MHAYLSEYIFLYFFVMWPTRKDDRTIKLHVLLINLFNTGSIKTDILLELDTGIDVVKRFF